MKFEYVSDGCSLYLKAIMNKSSHLVEVFSTKDKLFYKVDGITFDYMDRLIRYLNVKYE